MSADTLAATGTTPIGDAVLASVTPDSRREATGARPEASDEEEVVRDEFAQVEIRQVLDAQIRAEERDGEEDGCQRRLLESNFALNCLRERPMGSDILCAKAQQ